MVHVVSVMGFIESLVLLQDSVVSYTMSLVSAERAVVA
jgi:hypothetical protein